MTPQVDLRRLMMLLPDEDALEQLQALITILIDTCDDVSERHFRVMMADLHLHDLLIEVLESLGSEYSDVCNACMQALGVMCINVPENQVKILDLALVDALLPAMRIQMTQIEACICIGRIFLKNKILCQNHGRFVVDAATTAVQMSFDEANKSPKGSERMTTHLHFLHAVLKLFVNLMVRSGGSITQNQIYICKLLMRERETLLLSLGDAEERRKAIAVACGNTADAESVARIMAYNAGLTTLATTVQDENESMKPLLVEVMSFADCVSSLMGLQGMVDGSNSVFLDCKAALMTFLSKGFVENATGELSRTMRKPGCGIWSEPESVLQMLATDCKTFSECGDTSVKTLRTEEVVKEIGSYVFSACLPLLFSLLQNVAMGKLGDSDQTKAAELLHRVKISLDTLRKSVRNDVTNWWTSGTAVERQRQQNLVDLIIVCIQLWISKSPSINLHALPLEVPTGIGSSVTIRNWRRFEWAFKIHLKHVARAGPPGQPYICHGLLDIATMLWAKLPNEDGSVSDDVFARSLIEMLVNNLEDLSEDTVGYAMDVLRMMLYSVPKDLGWRVDGGIRHVFDIETCELHPNLADRQGVIFSLVRAHPYFACTLTRVCCCRWHQAIIYRTCPTHLGDMP
jgi:hypothetical protein